MIWIDKIPKNKIELFASWLFLVNSLASLGLGAFSVMATNSLSVLNDYMSYFLDVMFYGIMLLVLLKFKRSNEVTENYDIGKIEAFTSIFTSVLVLGYVGILLKISYTRLDSMEPFGYSDKIFAYYAIMLAKNMMVLFTIRVLMKRQHSQIIENGKIYMISCIMDNMIVLVPFFAYLLISSENGTLVIYVDLIAALFVCLSNVYLIFPTLKKGTNQLLDHCIDENLQLKILTILVKHFDQYNYLVHQYTRQSGHKSYIDLHMEFDESVLHGDIIDRIEKIKSDIENLIPDSEVNIIPERYKSHKKKKKQIRDHQK